MQNVIVWCNIYICIYICICIFDDVSVLVFKLDLSALHAGGPNWDTRYNTKRTVDKNKNKNNKNKNNKNKNKK